MGHPKNPTQFQSTTYLAKGATPGETLAVYTRRTRRQPSTDKALQDMTWRQVRRVRRIEVAARCLRWIDQAVFGTTM
jgi:ribosomal protein L28